MSETRDLCRFRLSRSRLSTFIVGGINIVLGAPVHCQLQAGVYDFGQSRFGERRGSWTPGEWLSLILLLMTICLGLALSVGLCYYVHRRQSQQSSSQLNYLKRQHLQASTDLLAREATKESAGSQGSVGRQQQGGSPGERSPRAVTDPSFYQGYNQQRQQPHRPMPNASLVVQI